MTISFLRFSAVLFFMVCVSSSASFAALPEECITPSELDYDVEAVKVLYYADNLTLASDIARRTTEQCDKKLRRHFAEEFGGMFLRYDTFEIAKAFYEIALQERLRPLDVYSPYAKSDYWLIARFARRKGMEEFAVLAENRAMEIQEFEERWKVGNVSDAETASWLRPLRESSDRILQSAYYSKLANLRLRQKRRNEAVALARKAFATERRLYDVTKPSDEAAKRMVDECWRLGEFIAEAGDNKGSVPVFRLGHRVAREFPVMKTYSNVLDPHCFRVALAQVKGVPLDEAFKSRFDSALDELIVKGPYDYLVLYRASDLYVDSIDREALFFTQRNRYDLAAKMYEREIPIMLSKIPDPDPFRGAVFASYHALFRNAQIQDPKSKSVPTCKTCGSNQNVVPDYPRGHRIISMHHWRCSGCNSYF